MSPLDKLTAYFEKFPGVGARQAKRFAFHILTLRPEQTHDLANLINGLANSVVECSSCRRFFPAQAQGERLCSICDSTQRDRTKLLVVARDNDITAIERSGVYDGLYFVLGGTIPLLTNNDTTLRLRTPALKAVVNERLPQGLSEIIFGFAVNPDGENTTRYVESAIKELPGAEDLKMSALGRGLSTGSELEYADGETIKSALKNRS
jgi:recombination protein RecR